MLEEQVKEAIVAELRRQADMKFSKLQVAVDQQRAKIDGEIDLDQLAMAVVGAVSGGP